jgi:hypothetical protein
MFTQNQKKWIVELQTSLKNRDRLIGAEDGENLCHRCCLGVYAKACGYETDIFDIHFEGGASDKIFRDFIDHYLYSILAEFAELEIFVPLGESLSYHIRSLTSMNDCRYFEFEHKFISKFLFAMPEYVFTNFKNAESPKYLKFSNPEDFQKHVEKLAESKQYDLITKSWKENELVSIDEGYSYTF